MNILPLILAFIIVFTLCSSLFMEEKKSTLLEEKHYSSFMLTERKLRNLLEKNQFVKSTAPIKKEVSGKPTPTLRKNAIYTSRRQASYPKEAAKLNIHLLLERPSPHLYEAAATLIKSLYSHKSFYAKDLEYQVLDTIIDMAKKNKDSFSFTTLPFYKIVKGTNYYNIETQEGYPPLQDYLCIDSKTKAANFCHAATPVLSALLGFETTRQILEKEQAKWEKDHKHHTVTKEELIHYKIPPDLYDLFNFSKHTPPKTQETLTDPLTKISLKKQPY